MRREQDSVWKNSYLMVEGILTQRNEDSSWKGERDQMYSRVEGEKHASGRRKWVASMKWC